MKKLSILLVILLILLFPFYLFTQNLSLSKLGERELVTYSLTDEQKEKIKLETSSLTSEEIIDYSTKFTCSLLSFTRKNNLTAREANCIGYAATYVAVCNYAFQVNHINGNAKHVYGYVMVGNSNLNSMVSGVAPSQALKNFTKDHDFVEVTSGKTHCYLSPTIADLLGAAAKTQF